MRVLCIDDNSDITDFCQSVLEAQGHSCLVTNNGRDGLDLIKKKESDLVLLDLAMPQFSGEDLIKELQKEGSIEQYNIYIFTASVITEEITSKLINLGVKDCIRKPIRLETLLGILQKNEK